MRSASSYRGSKKKAAREAKVPFGKFNEFYSRSRHFAAAEIERRAIAMSPEGARATLDVIGEEALEARRRLAEWAKNGGVVAQAELDAMNANQPMTSAQEDAAVDAAKKLTPEDIDKALEASLTKWQHEQHRVDPLPLSRLFAARARQLGWAEGVEFVEEK